MIFDSDDFGANHIISDMCQSHDCRDVLIPLHEANPNFKATLFAVPHEMTLELMTWVRLNAEWVQLAWHGFRHTSNYECEKLSYAEFSLEMDIVKKLFPLSIEFVKGFKAPGWQISGDIYEWLIHNGWWVADQHYNDERRPKELPVYHVGENSVHTHTWNCVGNGVYELFDDLLEKVKTNKEWRFVSESLSNNT